MRLNAALSLSVLIVLVGFCLPFHLAAQTVPGQNVKTDFVDPIFQPELYSQVMVSLDSGVDAQRFALDHGLTVEYQFTGTENTWLFNTMTVGQATSLTAELQDTAGVNWAAQNQQSGHETNSFTPNDPYFNNPPSPNNFGGQWHLNNNTGISTHVNPQGAWNNNITGNGVMIGIIDAGVEPGHEDIAGNFSAANTFDFVQNQSSQNLLSSDAHGTAVAGVAAAVGGNGIGVTGVAPNAGVSSQKVFEGGSAASSAGFAAATTFNSTGGSPTINVKNHSYGIPAPYISTPGETAALTSSAAAGTVHVGSAGNDRGSSGQDSNKKDLQNSVEMITVAALGADGQFSNYSSFGANVFVTAPSSDSGNVGVTTTDRTGSNGYNNGSGDYSNANYTAGFGGTSSSSPLVAGIMALGKEANPDMDVRLAKHILARTSNIVDAGDATTESDGGWRTNAAGFTFNQNYGFGNIDASAFVDMVDDYVVTPLVVADSGTQAVSASIPDNDSTGISRSVANSVEGTLEEVLVSMDITHTYRGDLEAYLVSPSGYSSRLMIRSGSDSSADIDWTFTTNAFWGEQAEGNWTVTLSDNFSGDTGVWNTFDITWRMGGLLQVVPEPGTAGLAAVLAIGFLAGGRRRRLAG